MKRIKTLIVDDSPVALQMAAVMLEQCGIDDVAAAVNGLQALEHFQRALMDGTPYALVLLDIVMPVLDGQETLKRMRAMENSVGVSADDRTIIVMATALHSADDMMDALFEGDCSDYLVKPFDAEDLRGMLKKHGLLA